MAAPSEGGRSLCEGMQDELGDILMRTVNIISNFFEMLDLDKNGNVELADLHRMQVRLLPYAHVQFAVARSSRSMPLAYRILQHVL